MKIMDFSKVEASFTKLKRQMDHLSTWKPENIHSLDLDYLKKLTQQFYGDLSEAGHPAQESKPKNQEVEPIPAPIKAPAAEIKEPIEEPITIKVAEPESAPPAKEESVKPDVPVATTPLTQPAAPSPAPVAQKSVEEVKEHIPNDHVEVMNPSMTALFDLPSSSDLSDLLRNRKIEHIGKAMGFNQKIFTVNELFNGDRDLFDTTIDKLNAMGSFDDAKSYLMNHVVKSLEWSSDKKIKSAQTFIRHISRKYQEVEA